MDVVSFLPKTWEEWLVYQEDIRAKDLAGVIDYKFLKETQDRSVFIAIHCGSDKEEVVDYLMTKIWQMHQINKISGKSSSRKQRIEWCHLFLENIGFEEQE